MSVLFDTGVWLATADGDPKAFAIFKRHYSYHAYADDRRSDERYANRFQFVGPGEKIVLVTPNYDALFAWRKFKDDSGQVGVNCACFRNESQQQSSGLILAAEEFAAKKWGGGSVFTPTSTRVRCGREIQATASSRLGG